MKTNGSAGLRRSAAVLSVLAVAVIGCGSDDDTSTTVEAEATGSNGEVSIADPWSREPADGQTVSAVYGVITNSTDESVTAVAASTSVTDSVELHEVVMDGEGQMTMQERAGGYVIGAGESVTLEPGGFHIMLLDIDPATYPDTVDMTIEFDDGQTIDFAAEVRAVDGMDEMHSDEMDSGEMDSGEMDSGEMDSGG